MSKVIKSNRRTANPKHWTVKDVFYGYTSTEKSNWYVTVKTLFTFENSGTLKYNYLKLKDDETPNTFNRLFYELNVVKGEAISLNLDKVTPFSLSVTSENSALEAEVITELKLATSTGQSSTKLFLDNLDSTIAGWDYELSTNHSLSAPTAPFIHNGNTYTSINVTLVKSTYFTVTPKHRLYAASNNIWNQTDLITGMNDVSDNDKYLGDAYVYDRFFKVTSDGKDLENDFEISIMPTNPYTLEIHKALNAGKYSQNELDNTKNRVSTLGYYIEKISSLLGHRIDANGDIDYQVEANLKSKILNNPNWKPGDKSYSQFVFGKKGMLVPSMPTSYDEDGKLQELWIACHDIPQLLAARMHDLNKSLGIEQGSEIRSKGLDGKVIGFPNQLSMAIDTQRKIQIIEATIEKMYSQGLVTAQEVRGLYAGIGIPVQIEKIPVKDAQGRVKVLLPYYTYQTSATSVLGHLSTLKINLGIVLGTLMPKKVKSILNPFKFLKK